MLAEVVLVTRLLGLVAGKQPVEVQVTPDVRFVKIVSDGTTLATLRGKPWNTVVDFGPELAPHELSAIAYDDGGTEVARDRQLVNLARPAAEAVIVLDRDRKSGALLATVRWQHIASQKPRRIEWKLDGKKIGKGERVQLPQFATSGLHVLRAQVEFRSNFAATKEIVFGGLYYEELPAELTAVVTHGTSDCFQLDGRTLRPSAIEKPKAQILFVRSSNPYVAQLQLRISGSVEQNRRIQNSFAIAGAEFRYTWPVAQHIASGEAIASLFYRSPPHDGVWGVHRMLTLVGGPESRSERLADAVAVAGVQTLSGGMRRVVILILGGERDASLHTPAVVRRYLELIRVPFRIWSLVPVTAKMTEAWGDVIDASTLDLLTKATTELRTELDQQRVVWLPLSPLDALRVEEADCASAP